MSMPTENLFSGPRDTSDLISMVSFTFGGIGASLSRWHRKCSERLRIVGKNSGHIFGVCGPNFGRGSKIPCSLQRRSSVVYSIFRYGYIRHSMSLKTRAKVDSFGSNIFGRRILKILRQFVSAIYLLPSGIVCAVVVLCSVFLCLY